MKRLLPLLLVGCGTFEGQWTDGRQKKLQFQLTGRTGTDHYPAGAPLAAGARVYLSCRGAGTASKLQVRAAGATLEREEYDSLPDKDNRWRISVPFDTQGSGKAALEVHDGATLLDALELDVKAVQRFRWEIVLSGYRNRRKGDGLELRVGDAVEIRVIVYDERGWELLGSGAFEAALEGEACCALKSEPRTNFLKVEAASQGRATLVFKGVAGSFAQLRIPVQVF
jgi:hypothetical protein